MPMSNETVKVALADDHRLFRQGLAEIISTIDNYRVVIEADHGKDLLEQLQIKDLPDLILLDINMPVMDGVDTCEALRQEYPDIKVLALSMYDQNATIIRMVKAGVHGYVLKDVETHELKFALDSVMDKGFYYSDIASLALANSLQPSQETERIANLNYKEIEFLKLICTEKTYKTIAEEMGVSPRTVDGYRDALFKKLKVKSRSGLMAYAIRNKVVIL